MSPISHQNELVKESLSAFLKQHVPSAQLSAIDGIVLKYVVDILEDLALEEYVEDAFDVEDYIEVMTGFFPEFSCLSKSSVCKWMLDLSSKLKQKHDLVFDKEEPLFPVPAAVKKARSPYSSESDDGRSPRTSEASDAGSENWDLPGVLLKETDGEECPDKDVEMLQEMFPTACQLEVQHCLSIAGGSMEKAAQLMLHRQENGESITKSSKSVLQMNQKPKAVLDDQALRNNIVAKYGFINKDEDKREYKPTAPKPEPKKLIRYRDSVIVSMKGERFSEVKKEETEAMKKTYVNLKPARQYRFH